VLLAQVRPKCQSVLAASATRTLLALWCIAVFGGTGTVGQKELRLLSIEDALAIKNFPTYMPVSLSPDGSSVAYTLQDSLKREVVLGYYTRTGAPRPALSCDVWVSNTDTGEAKNLTEGKGTSWAPAWSPDGNLLAFYSDRSGVARLWVWDKRTKKMRQISQVIVRSFHPLQVIRWTPDSKQVLTRILPQGMSLEDGERLMESLTQADTSAKRNDVTAVVFSSAAGPRRDNNGAKRELDALDSIRPYAADLALIDVISGDVKTVAHGFRPSDYWISPDGRNLAFIHVKGRQSGSSSQALCDLIVSSTSTGETRLLASNVQQLRSFVSWSPDSNMLSYTTAGPLAKGECFIVSVAGGQPSKAAKGAQPVFDGNRAPVWDRQGRFLYLLVGRNAIWKVSVVDGTSTELARVPDRELLEIVSPQGGGRFWSPDNPESITVSTRDSKTKSVGFYRVEIASGRVTKLLEENKHYGGPINFNIDISADARKIVYLAQDAAHPPDIWIADANFRSTRQVSHSNPGIEQHVLGESSLLEWSGADGQKVQGSLVLPARYKKGKRYPLIVYQYPSDRRSENVNYFGGAGTGVENMQLLSARGYAVLLPDLHVVPGAPMQGIAKTILPAIDKTIEMGIADPECLGVMGHSYGAYGVLALLVQTDRFRAAIMRGGYGNLPSFYGAMQTNGSARAQPFLEYRNGGGMEGTLWEQRQRYIENSPVFYLDKVKTPLLIIHGGADSNVPVHMADEVFADLRRLDKEVVYARYEGEDHSEIAWGYSNQIDYLNRMIGWFDKYLKKPQEK
jgi:dipeptidyl aminopeptidase/acylaminoacyl peptidase